MGDPSLVEGLAAFAVSARDEGIPDEVAASVRQRVLDVIGLQLAALPLPTSRSALAFAAEQGGAGQATAVGLEEPLPAVWAAFVGGVLAHSLDYDDTHLPSILHPSASVVPAALAAAERSGVGGAAAITAIAAGLEITVRIGMAGYDRTTNDSVFFAHGQHATSICGTLGAAAAASLVAGGDATDVANAMAVAASMASGIIEANRTGGTVKRLHCGWAAHAGVSAALLVDHGFTGPPTALEGRFGLFEAFLHGAEDTGGVTTDLGVVWAVPGIFFKPYPANHFTHCGIDAARRLRADGLQPDEVESAELRVATSTVRTIGEPLEIKQRPETGYQAQFSGPYTVAAGLLGGGGLAVNLDDFTDALAQDPVRRALMARITVAGDPDCDVIYPRHFPAVLTVTTTDGRVLEERVVVNRGSPDDPLSDDELATKFRDNASRWLDAATIATIERAVAALDHIEVAELMRLLRCGDRCGDATA